jgi:hypothetical protein
VYCLGSFVVLLLLNRHVAWRIPPAVGQERFALGAKMLDLSHLLGQSLHTPWLGPGLVIALLLLVTLRGKRTKAYKPLHRRFRMPKLERYRGEIPRRHRDLEI